MTANSHYDVVILGGGMVGASLACLLARQSTADKPWRILIVESHALPEPGAASPAEQPSFDARTTALSLSSAAIYRSVGLWDALSRFATPIKHIHVSDRGHWGNSVLDCEDEKLSALGYVVENQHLGYTLLTALQDHPCVDWCCPATAREVQSAGDHMLVALEHHNGDREISAELVVVADGARSRLCQQLGIASCESSYGQSAIIANVSTDQPHHQTAYERFTGQGPIALLPLADDRSGAHRSALIWTLPSLAAEEWMDASETLFLEQLQWRFGYRLGRFQQLGKRFMYPLQLCQAEEQFRRGLVVMGNAAHSLHPVAGQGYNLALRDVQALVTTLQEAREDGESIAGLDVLQKYWQRQSADQQRTIHFSDQLPRLFGQQPLAVEVGRGLGLLGLDLLPPLKSGFVSFATGLMHGAHASL